MTWFALVGSLTGTAGQALDRGFVKRFLSELPEKALNLGVRVLLAGLFFLLGVQVIRLARRLLRKSMQRTKAEVGVIQFMDSFVKASLYGLLVMMIASSLGVDAASIVAVVGSAGVALGLALQGSLSNLAGGVLILLLKPFKVGDYIQESLTGKEGTVTEIQIFYTKLLTFDNKAVVLPNGSLANNSVVNISAQPDRRLDISVTVAYEADVAFVKETLLKVLEEDEAVIKEREWMVFVDELTSLGMKIGVRCWLRQEDFWPGRYRLTENCKLALDRAGIRIPYQQLEVRLEKS